MFKKMVHEMAMLTEFDNLHISFKVKECFAKKLSSSFCHTLAYLP